MQSAHAFGVQSPCLRKVRQQAFRPQDLDIACGERAADQRPVSVHETQDPAHRDLLADNAADGFDLREDTVNQLGAVPAADDQAFHPRTHEPAFDPQPWTSGVLLRVDDVDACRRYSEVVDVRATAGHAAVMEHTARLGLRRIQATLLSSSKRRHATRFTYQQAK